MILIPILNNLVYIGNASFPLQYDIESMSGSSEYMLSGFLDIIFGEYNPSRKLPYELPSSWDAVLEQKEDLPYDSKRPLYKFGYGLSYNEL